MAWFAAASIGMSAYGAYKGSRAAKKAGKAAAELTRQETAEQIRRTRAQQQQQVGQTRAVIGGSGVAARSGGSADQYLSGMERENMRNIDWMKRSGELRARQAKRTGQQVADNIAWQGAASVFGQASNWAASGLRKSFNETDAINTSGVVKGGNPAAAPQGGK